MVHNPSFSLYTCFHNQRIPHSVLMISICSSIIKYYQYPAAVWYQPSKTTENQSACSDSDHASVLAKKKKLLPITRWDEGQAAQVCPICPGDLTPCFAPFSTLCSADT